MSPASSSDDGPAAATAVTTAELTVVVVDGAQRVAGDLVGAVRERIAGREGIDLMGVIRERLAGRELGELMGAIRERPPDRSLGELMGAIEERLAAQSRVRFEVHGSGVTLEGAATDIFSLAAELHELPIEMGMPHVRTFLKLESGGDRPNGRPPANGHRGQGPGASRLSGARAGRAGRGESGEGEVDAGAEAPAPPIAVKIAGLKKTYGDGDTQVEALKGIDLDIRRGDFVAVMGPSGSGKSTLMHILGALESASEGTIEIGGISYGDLDDSRQTELRRDRIGFVFQFFNLLKTLSAAENVMLPSLLAGDRVSDLRERAGELLGMVGLSERRDHLPSQMSGGEQQRVSIARALMRKPELLLADEPTGNLDSRNSAAVLDMLARLQSESGHTILMVTHDPVAASRATRVIFLKDGLVAGEIAGGDSNRIVERFSQLSSAPRSED